MDDILKCYGQLLKSVDEWFSRVSMLAGSDVECRKGCAECCRGLFDITLLDACYLKSGFDSLPASIKYAARASALMQLDKLHSLWPEFAPPYILNYRSEEEWDDLMPEEDETPCLLLGEDGHCMVYQYRPMTCRLHGLPLVDISGEVMHDEWCTLNFVEKDPLGIYELRWEFNRLFGDELRLFRPFTEKLLGFPVSELDTFIPTALLIDFAGFDWRRWGDTLMVGTDLNNQPGNAGF